LVYSDDISYKLTIRISSFVILKVTLVFYHFSVHYVICVDYFLLANSAGLIHVTFWYDALCHNHAAWIWLQLIGQQDLEMLSSQALLCFLGHSVIFIGTVRTYLVW